MTDTPKLKIDVSGTLVASNGLLVQVTPTTVRIEKPGPQGGRGAIIEIPDAEWDTIHSAVTAVRNALRETRDIVDSKITPRGAASAPAAMGPAGPKP